jgi:hypothetical protein
MLMSLKTAPVSYRAKSNFYEGFLTSGMRGVAFIGSVQLCGSHAGDVRSWSGGLWF